MLAAPLSLAVQKASYCMGLGAGGADIAMGLVLSADLSKEPRPSPRDERAAGLGGFSDCQGLAFPSNLSKKHQDWGCLQFVGQSRRGELWRQ